MAAGAWPGRASEPLVLRGDLRRSLQWLGRGLLDWLPLYVALFVYDEINNWLGPLLPPPHARSLIHFDQWLFGGAVPAVWLQRAFYTDGQPRAWDWAALAIYCSHFFVTLLCALVLWLRSRPAYLRYMSWVVALTTLGFATYIALPAVPPWLASQRGLLAPTHRIVRELWQHLGWSGMAALFSGSNLYANDVAALPSLHAAYPLLMAIFLWRTSRPWARAALAAYALVMPVVLIYFAEHYALDILLGWLYVGVSLLLVRRLWRLLARREAA